ncbi:MAG: LysR family transcriptional regulator ArgP [Paracoccaceae bacterium]
MRFDYPLLEALAAVVREGTFEAAARTLNITQSAVSQRVKLLEEKTGAVLIRRGRPCVPTEQGMKLYRHIDQVQLLEHELEKAVLGLDESRRSLPVSIRMAVNADSLAIWFAEVVARAGQKLRISFDIVPDDQEHTASRLRSGEALAAVTAEAEPVQGCRRISLGSMEYVAVASPRFVQARLPDGIDFEAVLAAPVVFFDRKDMLQEQWLLAAFGRTGVMRCHYVPSFQGYLSACLLGCGWGLVPRPTVDDYLRAGTLVDLTPGFAVPVALYWQASVRESEVMRDLAAIVVDVAKKYLRGS